MGWTKRGVRFPARTNKFLCTSKSLHLVQRLTETLSPAVNRPGSEADSSLPYTADVNEETHSPTRHHCVQKTSLFRHVRKIAKKRLLASSCPSVRPSVCLSAWNNSAPTGRILIEFYVCVFFENLSRKFKFH